MIIRKGTLVRACVLVVLLVILIISFLSAFQNKNKFYTLFDDSALVLVSGHIYHKEFKNDKFVYYIKNAEIISKDASSRRDGCRQDKLRVLVRTDIELPIYADVRFEGKIAHFAKARNEGGFDNRQYYEGMGIFCEIKPDIETFSISKAGLFKRIVIMIGEGLYALSQRIETVYEYALPGEESGVMSAIALGSRGGLDAGVRDILSGAGIIHIIAVSGLHISVLGRGLYRLLRRLGTSYLASGIISFSVVLLYAFMCKMSVSCIRAVGMFLIFLVAQIIGRVYDMGRAAVFMAILVLIYNPFFLFSSSFVFSFGAVAGIVIVAGPVSEYVYKITREKLTESGMIYHSKIRAKLILSVVSSVASTVCITLFTVPIVAWFYYEIPTYSFLINLFVIPFIGVLLCIGLAGGVLSLAFVPASKILLFPCHLIIYYIEIVADKSMLLPGAKFICGRPALWSVVVYYLVLILASKVLLSMQEKRGDIFIKSYAFQARITACGSAVVMTFLIMLLSKSLVSDYRISFIDVGQGDGIFLTDGRKCNVMIDGGSTSEKQLGKYTILPFLKYNAVRKVDYWFVSHCDEDHVQGLKYAAQEGYRIGAVYMSCNVQKDEGYDSLLAVLSDAGIPVRYLVVGDRLVTDKFTLTCIFPDTAGAASIGNDANGKSMVMRLDDVYGHKGLFVGDMNETAERLLLSGDGRKYLHSNSGFDFLKVAHHGSKYSTTTEFLYVIRPKVAIISYGRNNYGHPSEETLNRLAASNARVLKTKECGQVTIQYIKNRKTKICTVTNS